MEKFVTSGKCLVKLNSKRAYFSHTIIEHFKVEFWGEKSAEEAVMGVDLIISCAAKLPG